MDAELASAAEQRAFAVAKLKRAASLPRMKDGRRPPMHPEGFSEGEKIQAEEKQETEESTSDGKTVVAPEEKPAAPESVPESAPRSKRRSRSRSRSRGSKDLKGKGKIAPSPIPSPLIQGNDSSPEDSPAPPPPPAMFQTVTPLLSPIPSHFAGMPASRLLLTPTLLSPESPLLYPGTSPPTPLPSLEAIQKGLFRSNSAAARMMAMHKLTGGTEGFDQSFASPSLTTSESMLGLGRNNTISGGERYAARKLLLRRLRERIKEADGEQTSGGEEKDIIVPVHSRRRKRRSGRHSNPLRTPEPTDPDSRTDEHIGLSSPLIPGEILASPGALSQSQIEFVPGLNPQPDNWVHTAEPLLPSYSSPSTDPEPPRKRRSIIVEDDEDRDDCATPQLPDRVGRSSNHAQVAATRIPHSSDAPSYGSTDSNSVSGVRVPVYMSGSQHIAPQNDRFPTSPFTTPLKEKASRDEDEEEVLYEAESFRRSPYHDAFEREISWVAEPVPQSRIPVHDEDVDDEDADAEDEEETPPPESPKEDFSTHIYESSPRASTDSKELIVESEVPLEPSVSEILHSHSPSLAALSSMFPTSMPSDDSNSPPAYPQRLSVASRIQSDRSPLTTDFELDDPRGTIVEGPTKRVGDSTSTSRWEKMKSTFTRSNSGRRSRSNSIITRERRDNTDSSVSRESGASLTSPKIEKVDASNNSLGQQQGPQGLQNQQAVMQSSSASTSVLSLAPQTPPRGGVSPIPPASSADLLKYKDAKLFPFPGMKKLEEQRKRARGMSLSSSTPDIVLSGRGTDGEQQATVSSSSSNTPSHSPEMDRERKLSHQASDTRLLSKFRTLNSPALSSAQSTSSHADYFNVSPSPPTQPGSRVLGGLPTNREGVRKWLSARLFSQGPSATNSNSNSSSASDARSPAGKKPSLSDVLRSPKQHELSAEEEFSTDKSRTPTTSASGSTLLGRLVGDDQRVATPTSNKISLIHDELQNTPRGNKPLPNGGESQSLMDLPSPVEPPSSTTPDPLSSLSDYPGLSTSGSSSNTSSQYSQYASQGAIVLERLAEMLRRGLRSPMWASVIDDPPRKLLLSSPVLQVVNSNTVKERFLFLFNDILIIAKPIIQEQDALLDLIKPSPLDRKFVVKNVVLLRHLCLNADREEPQTRIVNYAAMPRSTLMRAFIGDFAGDCEWALGNLFVKSGCQDEYGPAAIGPLLLRTLELNRAALGAYLSRKTAKLILKHYVDAFGFSGLRVDKALRAFLHSVRIPSSRNYGYSTQDHLLESFTSRWYEANVGIVAYDKDLAVRFVRAIVQLNDVLHGKVSHDSESTAHSRRNVTSRDFLDAFRRYDPRGLISDELLGDVYDSIRREKLSQARSPSPGGSSAVFVTFKRALPSRLTYRVQSDPIILRIPQPDPHFSIQLYGQDLTFDPQVLTFAKSTEASFRVTGTSFGPKTIILLRSGMNALVYSGLPPAFPVVVERAFMRNTFQVSFPNHNGQKRRYMFSVDDPLIRHEWTASLKREIEACQNAASANDANSSSPRTSKFHHATATVAFKILQETLHGSEMTPLASEFVKSASLHHNRGDSGSSADQPRMKPLRGSAKSAPVHVRSRSRTGMHKDGQSNGSLGANDQRLASHEEDETSMSDNHDRKDQPHAEEKLWTGRDLEMHCQQNSSIALVLSFLQVGIPDPDDFDS